MENAVAKGKDWYVIHTYSGYENKVKLSLEERFAHHGVRDKLGEIVIPTEEVVEVRQGKKKISSRKEQVKEALPEQGSEEGKPLPE